MAEGDQNTVPEWVNTLPEAYRDNPTVLRYKTMDGFLKSMLDRSAENTRLQQELKRFPEGAIVVPGKDADEAAVKDFRTKMGIPEDANGYELPHKPAKGNALPHELTDDQATAEYASIQQLAFDLDLPKDKAVKLAEHFNRVDAERNQRIEDRRANTIKERDAELRRIYGDDLQGLMNSLPQLYPVILPVDEDGTDRLTAFFNQEYFPGGVGKSVLLSEILFNTLRATNPGRFVPSNDNRSTRQTDRNPDKAMLDYGDKPGPVGVRFSP